jgi:hypothetical protein
MNPDTVLTVRQLRGTLCQCGCLKTKGQTFCSTCYYRLPEPMRAALYKSLADGYMDAYHAAMEFLKEKKK